MTSLFVYVCEFRSRRQEEGIMYRWHATVTYRTDAGPLAVEHDLEELAELHDLVELGPHWDTVIEIRVVRVGHVDGATLTVEQAMSLHGPVPTRAGALDRGVELVRQRDDYEPGAPEC